MYLAALAFHCQIKTRAVLLVELIAENLKRASDFLGEIKAPYTSDELLGEIFSSFCIGK